MNLVAHWPNERERADMLAALGHGPAEQRVYGYIVKLEAEVERLCAATPQGAVGDLTRLVAYERWRRHPRGPAPMTYDEVTALLDRIGGGSGPG